MTLVASGKIGIARLVITCSVESSSEACQDGAFQLGADQHENVASDTLGSQVRQYLEECEKQRRRTVKLRLAGVNSSKEFGVVGTLCRAAALHAKTVRSILIETQDPRTFNNLRILLGLPSVRAMSSASSEAA